MKLCKEKPRNYVCFRNFLICISITFLRLYFHTDGMIYNTSVSYMLQDRHGSLSTMYYVLVYQYWVQFLLKNCTGYLTNNSLKYIHLRSYKEIQKRFSQQARRKYILTIEFKMMFQSYLICHPFMFYSLIFIFDIFVISRQKCFVKTSCHESTGGTEVKQQHLERKVGSSDTALMSLSFFLVHIGWLF